MKRTVLEWVNFLGTDENQLIGIKSKDGNSPHRRNYFIANEFIEKFGGWLNDIVINVYVCNSIEDGKNYHLLIIE